MTGAGQRFRCLVASCDRNKTYSLTTLYEHLSYHGKDMGFLEIFEYECQSCKGAYFTNRMFMVDHKVKFPHHQISRLDLDLTSLPHKLVNGVNKMNGELLRTLFEPVGTSDLGTAGFGHTSRSRERSVSITSVYAPRTPYMMSPACSRAGSPASVRGVSPASWNFRNNVHPDMGNDYANVGTMQLSGNELGERRILEQDKMNSVLNALSHPTMPDAWKDKILKYAFQESGTQDNMPRSRHQSDSAGMRDMGGDSGGGDRNSFGGFRRQSEGDDDFRGRGEFRRSDLGGFRDSDNNFRGGFRNDRDEDRDSDRGLRGGRGGFRAGRGRGDFGGFRGRGRGEFRGRGGFRGGFGNRNDSSFRRGGSPSDGPNENRKRSHSRDGLRSPVKDPKEKRRSRSYSRSHSRSVSPVTNQNARESPTAETPKKKANAERQSYSRSPNS